MEPLNLEIVVAADHEPFRARVAQILRQAGIVPAVEGRSTAAFHLTPGRWAHALVILDTNDDVARLMQIVNDLHRSPYHPGGGLPVICVVSSDAFQRNQTLGWWLIDGLAAVFAVWTRDGREWEQLPVVIRRLSGAPPAEPAAVRPGYEECVRRMFEDPSSAEAILALAARLMEWQSLTRMKTELVIALLRQAIRYDPASAEARTHLAQALSWHGEKEEAVREAREAIRLQLGLAEAHLHLGSALCDLGLKAEARAELETAIALDREGRVGRWARNTLSSRRL